MAVRAPIVQQLIEKIESEEGWSQYFETAIQNALSAAPKDMEGMKDLDSFYTYLDDFLVWVPFENNAGREVYNRIVAMYFIFDQEPVNSLQTPIAPSSLGKRLSWISDWLVRYAAEMGKFLDTPESLTNKTLQTFRNAKSYHMNDYIEPHGGWKTFNDFFARHVKPGYRPIADIANPHVIVSPADSTFDGQWQVDSNSEVDIKGIKWSIKELLADSKYGDQFAGGVFMHSFLGPNDYHRQHAPVGGRVVEAKIIKGQAYLEVTVDSESGRLRPVRKISTRPKPKASSGKDLFELEAPDNAGYQFCQMRGLVVLDTPIGLVAVLPIGMAQVSSVILTAEEGKTLHKGEEISYFQFGGSDIVLVFQAISNVKLTANVETHYNMGTEIGRSEFERKSGNY